MKRRLIAVALAFACAAGIFAPGSVRAGDTPETRAGRSALVASINAKLARWVHPTGKCGLGQSEQLATFYWQGRRTASGEAFHAGDMTAAHRRLPFGTMLAITNPHNGRSVTVRINDRGPFTHAKIDLAYGAAMALDMKQSSYLCVTELGGPPIASTGRRGRGRGLALE
jgi:rare lipoprotein A (peptidoglycan hydrolase)